MNYSPSSRYQRGEIIKIMGNAYKAILDMNCIMDRFYKNVGRCKEEINTIIEEGDIYLSHFIDDEDWLKLSSDVDEPGYVYYLTNADKDMVKIGVSKNPTQRAKTIQTSSGQNIEIAHTIQFDDIGDAYKAENKLHDIFYEYRFHPSHVAKSCEWFNIRILPVLLEQFDTKEKIFKFSGLKPRI